MSECRYKSPCDYHVTDEMKSELGIASSGNSDLLLAERIVDGISCMEALITYVDDFGLDIDPKVVRAEAGEAILRLLGRYGQ
jgi:hypothetical protein